MKILKTIEDDCVIRTLVNGGRGEARMLVSVGTANELWSVHGRPRWVYFGRSTSGKFWQLILFGLLIAFPANR